jgi:uncharacterized membrane protein
MVHTVPYLPQTSALIFGRLFNVQPLIEFYAGRIANLAVAIALIGAALRVAPSFRNIIGATAILPMSLFEFASWSADALTLALAILFTALLVEGGGMVALVSVGFVLGLCKPAYFLLSLLVLVVPGRSARGKLMVIASTLLATAFSFAYAHAASYQQRGGLPIDPVAQIRCLLHDPFRFLNLIFTDLAAHWRYYIDGIVGRLGLNEMALPTAVVVIEILTLVVAALTSKRVLGLGIRLTAIGIVLATMIGVMLSQYMIWSIVCGDTIEGVQGRYFLPVVPLALLALSFSSTRWRVELRVIAIIAIVCNAIAFVEIVRRYWI